MTQRQRKLGRKLTAILIAYFAVAVVAVGFTLLMSWQLEGGAAAVNEMGSQRMRAYRIALLLAQTDAASTRDTALAGARGEVLAFDRVLRDLEQGDSSRPLVMPHTHDIVERFDRLLGSQGRIARENWVEQAQILAKNGDTAHSRDYDRRAASAPIQPIRRAGSCASTCSWAAI